VPVVLLVVCPKASVARWAARPLEFGPGAGALQPLVVGPDRVPVRPGSQRPELAMLAALIHGDGPDRRGALENLVETAVGVAGDRRVRYLEMAYAALSAAGRRCLEELMETRTEPELTGLRDALVRRAKKRARQEGLAEGLAAGRTAGRTAGLADATIAVLQSRGLAVDEPSRDRIQAATLDELERWIHRAPTVASVPELLADH